MDQDGSKISVSLSSVAAASITIAQDSSVDSSSCSKSVKPKAQVRTFFIGQDYKNFELMRNSFAVFYLNSIRHEKIMENSPEIAIGILPFADKYSGCGNFQSRLLLNVRLLALVQER